MKKEDIETFRKSFIKTCIAISNTPFSDEWKIMDKQLDDEFVPVSVLRKDLKEILLLLEHDMWGAEDLIKCGEDKVFHKGVYEEAKEIEKRIIKKFSPVLEDEE